MFRVFKAHQLVAEYPLDVRGVVSPQGDLTVYQGMAQVGHHAAKTWHGFGHNAQCAFLDPDPNCPNCQKAAAGE